MPERIVRPGILTSESVNALSFGAEVFYRRLMSVVDDFGRFDARLPILLAALYPLKLDQVAKAHIEQWLAECSTVGLVIVYQVEGKPYLELQKFNQRLRTQSSKWPECPQGIQISAPPTSADICPQSADIGGQIPPYSETETETETEASADCAHARARAEAGSERQEGQTALPELRGPNDDFTEIPQNRPARALSASADPASVQLSPIAEALCAAVGWRCDALDHSQYFQLKEAERQIGVFPSATPERIARAPGYYHSQRKFSFGPKWISRDWGQIENWLAAQETGEIGPSVDELRAQINAEYEQLRKGKQAGRVR